MKLASLAGGRDGRLVVVSDDLAWHAEAGHIVASLQAALDDWPRHEPALRSLARDLEHGAIPCERFHERLAAAPLPRAYRRFGGHDAGDALRGARDPIAVTDGASLDVVAGVCVVTGDVPRGATREEALAAILLVGLVGDVSPREPDAGTLQAELASHFSPVLATPEALGASWRDGVLDLPLLLQRNGRPAAPAAADAQGRDLAALVAGLARSRRLGAGTIVGPVLAPGHGSASAAEAAPPVARIEGLRHGDVVRIEMRDPAGRSIFGAIEGDVADA